MRACQARVLQRLTYLLAHVRRILETSGGLFTAVDRDAFAYEVWQDTDMLTEFMDDVEVSGERDNPLQLGGGGVLEDAPPGNARRGLRHADFAGKLISSFSV